VIDGQFGVINKILGDGLIAFFTGEEQALRAVRAAVAIQKKARELRPKWQAAGDKADLRLRIGVATGIVSAGERKLRGHTEYSLDGEAVTLAARLQEKANAGGILISRESYEDVRESFTCGEMKGLELKGYDDSRTRGGPPRPSRDVARRTPPAREAIPGVTSAGKRRWRSVTTLATTP
jgi:class 3 adenylate cyclase